MNRSFQKTIFFLLGFCICSKLIYCQENNTKIIIDGKGKITYPGTLEIRFKDFFIRESIDSNCKVAFIIPRLIKGEDGFSVLYRKDYSEMISTAWASGNINFNGSGFVLYDLKEGQLGFARQWPAVTWKSTKNVLDLYMNGEAKGSTDLTRGIEPEKNHRFVWKFNSEIICDTTLSLPYNVKRTCTCDEEKKKVSIK